jgi:hypothetical protein
METADTGLGRPDASVGSLGRGEVVIGEGRSPRTAPRAARRDQCRGRSVGAEPMLARVLGAGAVAARAEFVVEVVSGHDRAAALVRLGHQKAHQVPARWSDVQ